MADNRERIGTLEMRVEQLETWAGPGQAGALAAGLRGVRSELAVLRRVQDQHTGMLSVLKADVAELKADVAQLKADVAGLKADVAELKAGFADMKLTLQEILRRLPPGPAVG